MSKEYKTLLGTIFAAGLAGCLQTQNRSPESLYHWHKQKNAVAVSTVKTQDYVTRCSSQRCDLAEISSRAASVQSATAVLESKLFCSSAPITSGHGRSASGLGFCEPLIVRELVSIDRGYVLGGSEKEVCIMRNLEELSARWTKLYARNNTKRVLPLVDFSREIVVGAFQGEQKNGYETTIIGAIEGNKVLAVFVQETEVPRGRKYHNKPTQSYHLVILPATTKEIKVTYLKAK